MAAALAGLVVLVWSANSNVGDKRHELTALQTQINKLPAPVVVTPTTSASATPNREVTVSSLAQDRLSWDGFLGAISRVLPEDVWLQTLSANSPGAATTLATTSAGAVATSSTTDATGTAPIAAPASTPSTFTISGYTYSQPSVARLMRRLTLVPWLADVNLVSTAKTTINKTTVYQFSVGANVVPQPGGAS